MNQQQRAVIKQALEVLKRCQMNEAYRDFQQESDTITALRQLLEQQEPVQSAERGEPVWIQPDHLQKAKTAPFLCRVEPHKRDDFIPLYTTSPAQPASQRSFSEPKRSENTAWVGLTDEDVLATNYPKGEEGEPTIAAPNFDLLCFGRKIEARLREKNGA